MRSVNDAIQDRVSQSWIPNNLVPATYGNLAGDQQRPFPFPVVDDLQLLPSLLGIQRFSPPVVEDQQPGPLQAPHQAPQPPLATSRRKVGEQAWCPPIEHREPITAGFMA